MGAVHTIAKIQSLFLAVQRDSDAEIVYVAID